MTGERAVPAAGTSGSGLLLTGGVGAGKTTLAVEIGELREVRDSTLLVSELVTNALVHGRGTIELRARLDENHLIVEVIDDGKGFERVVRKRDFDNLGGWGLSLVDALASRWGIHDGRSHVWFELERCRPRPGPFNQPVA
jgi:hypothetical protein